MSLFINLSIPHNLVRFRALWSSSHQLIHIEVQLHNALIISLFDATAHHRLLTPPPDIPKPSPRKRRRTLPYQGPDALDTLRSSRLKRWTISLGKREREHVRNLKSVPPLIDPAKLKTYTDEIARERGVILLQERGGK
jgi:hypothetical protein